MQSRRIAFLVAKRDAGHFPHGEQSGANLGQIVPSLRCGIQVKPSLGGELLDGVHNKALNGQRHRIDAALVREFRQPGQIGLKLGNLVIQLHCISKLGASLRAAVQLEQIGACIPGQSSP